MAEAIETVNLCREFNCLPSQLYAEDGSFLRMIELERLARGDG